MDDNKFWVWIMAMMTIIVLAIIVAVTTYEIAYQYAPVRPQQSSVWYWPR